MALIELGGRNFLLYLVLPHPWKMALLSEASRALGVIPGLRHFAAVLAIEARRGDRVVA